MGYTKYHSEKTRLANEAHKNLPAYSCIIDQELFEESNHRENKLVSWRCSFCKNIFRSTRGSLLNKLKSEKYSALGLMRCNSCNINSEENLSKLKIISRLPNKGRIIAGQLRPELQGLKSPNYKHGHYSKYNPTRLEQHDFYWKPKWWAIRKYVFNRDNYLCQICFSNRYLVAHHITPAKESIGNIYNEFNIITLCKPCHSRKAHGSFQYGINPDYKIILLNRINEIYIYKPFIDLFSYKENRNGL